MTVSLMVVAVLGSGSGEATALNVTEIGTFDDQAKCKAAIACASFQ